MRDITGGHLDQTFEGTGNTPFAGITTSAPDGR
jgi:hypothetical protein